MTSSFDHPNPDRLDEYVDHTLPPDEAAAIHTHVAACTECQRYVSRLQQLSARLARLPREATRVPEIQAAVQARLARLVAPSESRLQPRRLLMVSSTIAAVFVLGVITGQKMSSRPLPLPASSPLASTYEVQRAGSFYIASLARFNASSRQAPSRVASLGREVAISTLLGAAVEALGSGTQDSSTVQLLELAQRVHDEAIQRADNSTTPPRQ